jgi:hypothetical protein
MSSNNLKMLSEIIRSRSLLRGTEEDPIVRAFLNKYIADCQESFARYSADNGQYANAFHKVWQALYTNFCWRRFLGSCRNIARTIMMAIGLHTPKANCR